jgi:hypothetical protein
MSLRRGDFALVYFPHSDLRTVKLRPVLAVQAENLNTGLPRVIVAMVSSNMAHAVAPASGRHFCCFLLFQPLGQQNLEQRLIGNITLVGEHFEPGDERFRQAQ